MRFIDYKPKVRKLSYSNNDQRTVGYGIVYPYIPDVKSLTGTGLFNYLKSFGGFLIKNFLPAILPKNMKDYILKNKDKLVKLLPDNVGKAVDKYIKEKLDTTPIESVLKYALEQIKPAKPTPLDKSDKKINDVINEITKGGKLLRI